MLKATWIIALASDEGAVQGCSFFLGVNVSVGVGLATTILSKGRIRCLGTSSVSKVAMFPCNPGGKLAKTPLKEQRRIWADLFPQCYTQVVISYLNTVSCSLFIDAIFIHNDGSLSQNFTCY